MTIYMKKFTLIFFLAFSSFCFGKAGLAEWSVLTPHGNEINNFDDSRILSLSNQSQLDNIAEWYFYKDYIMGRLGTNGKTTGYFAVNETIFYINTFQTKDEWIKFLQQNDLQPKIWTRWYKSDWTFFNIQLLMFLVFGFYVSIPLIILYWIVLFKAFKKEKLNIRKPNTIVLTCVTGFIFIAWLLEHFPQSI